MWSNAQKSTFSDLFVESKICLPTGVKFARYVSSTYRNWNNYKLDNNSAAAGIKIEDNNDENMGGELMDNPYEPYDVYD